MHTYTLIKEDYNSWPSDIYWPISPKTAWSPTEPVKDGWPFTSKKIDMFYIQSPTLIEQSRSFL